MSELYDVTDKVHLIAGMGSHPLQVPWSFGCSGWLDCPLLSVLQGPLYLWHWLVAKAPTLLVVVQHQTPLWLARNLRGGAHGWPLCITAGHEVPPGLTDTAVERNFQLLNPLVGGLQFLNLTSIAPLSRAWMQQRTCVDRKWPRPENFQVKVKQ